MPLAAILGLCVALSSAASGGQPQRIDFAQEPQTPPDSPQNAAPAPPPNNPATPPDASQQPQTNEPKTEQTPPAATSPTPKATTPQKQTKSTSASKKKKHRKLKPTATKQGPDPGKRVVRNGSTEEPVMQLSPGLSDNEASSERQNTIQLLTTADTNLQKMSGRQLNTTQQDVVSQIRKYIEQAKEAETAGDLQRARNLALKARLLSDDLVRQ
jgi:hypothetical protein